MYDCNLVDAIYLVTFLESFICNEIFEIHIRIYLLNNVSKVSHLFKVERKILRAGNKLAFPLVLQMSMVIYHQETHDFATLPAQESYEKRSAALTICPILIPMSF